VNMLTSMYAKALPHMRVNCVDPGYTATDLNAHRGAQTVEEGAEIIVRMAQVDGSGPTGVFVDRHGGVPW
jgi:NAD(P)-dependent dehydrogenase (short-subunit alcohol dehydrogenase family)